MNVVDAYKMILNDLDYSISIKSISGNVIQVCSTKGITKGKIITDELGNEYKITNMVFNTSLTIDKPLIGQKLFANKPLFLEGTPSATNEEYLRIDHLTSKKTPFVWLLEGYSYGVGTLDSNLAFDVDARLFIMDWADPNKTNEDHENNVIKPMENLARMIKNYIDNNYQFRRVESWRIKPRKRFGVEVTNKGNRSLIIEENLSGVEVSFNLKMFDFENCEC